MAMIYCYECGKKISENADKCLICGAPNRIKTPNPPPRQWLVAFLLCLLLGPWGAHRFYMRRTTSAIVMLVLSLTVVGLLITGIWTLVDLIVLLCHTDDDDYINGFVAK